MEDFQNYLDDALKKLDVNATKNKDTISEFDYDMASDVSELIVLTRKKMGVSQQQLAEKDIIQAEKILGVNEKFDESAMIKHYQDLEKNRRPQKTNDYAIYVDGLPKAQVKLASCCHPVFGDPIIGYVSKGNGIVVHRFECHNVKNSQEERFIERYP